MPVVTVELPAPAPPGVAHALIDACSQTVREGRCVLATDQTPEATGARASVSWSDPTELVAQVEVEVTTGAARGARRRTITFRQSDARVERWRTVGLTIATLVGDVLHPKSSDANGAETPGSAPEFQPLDEHPPSAATASADAPQVPKSEPAEPLSPPPPAATSSAVPAGAGAEATPHRLWVSLVALTGPGLDRGSWRFGGGLELGYRPGKLPLFGRLAVAYAVRPTDAQELFVAWETLSLGGGATFALSSLSLEPRISLGMENVHAAASTPARNASDSGNELGVNVRAGFDAVWQWPRFGIVGGIEGWRAHAPTQVVIQGRVSGVSAAWGWGLALGGRLFLD